MNLKKKYGNYELHPQMKITGYENEIWDEKKEIIEELKLAVQEKQKVRKKRKKRKKRKPVFFPLICTRVYEKKK